MSTLPPPSFPIWVRPAIADAAEQLYAKLKLAGGPPRAFEVLMLLTSDPRMRFVWQELYKKWRDNHKATEQYFHPASITNATEAARLRRVASELWQKGGEKNDRDAKNLEFEASATEALGDPPADPRWSEQDYAVKYFFNAAHRIALDFQPVYLSDLQNKLIKLRKVAKRLRKDAATLHSLGKNTDGRELEEIASRFDDDARIILPGDGDGDDPWIITRRTGDIRIRAFVADLSIITGTLFRKTLYSTIATVTNVVFNRQNMTGPKIREMLRLPPDPGD